MAACAGRTMFVVRPALAFAVILAVSACGLSGGSAPAAPATSVASIEEELSLEVSALM